MTGALVNRLTITDYWSKPPELADQVITAPLFIVGVSRSGTTALSQLLSVDRAAFEGPMWTRVLTEMIERTTAARAALGDHRFIDVDYGQLVSDPVGAVRGIYRDLGESVDDALEALLVTHANEYRQHKHGRHSYTFEEFCLNRDALNERFSTYRNTYDL